MAASDIEFLRPRPGFPVIEPIGGRIYQLVSFEAVKLLELKVSGLETPGSRSSEMVEPPMLKTVLFSVSGNEHRPYFGGDTYGGEIDRAILYRHGIRFLRNNFGVYVQKPEAIVLDFTNSHQGIRTQVFQYGTNIEGVKVWETQEADSNSDDIYKIEWALAKKVESDANAEEILASMQRALQE